MADVLRLTLIAMCVVLGGGFKFTSAIEYEPRIISDDTAEIMFQNEEELRELLESATMREFFVKAAGAEHGCSQEDMDVATQSSTVVTTVIATGHNAQKTTAPSSIATSTLPQTETSLERVTSPAMTQEPTTNAPCLMNKVQSNDKCKILRNDRCFNVVFSEEPNEVNFTKAEALCANNNNSSLGNIYDACIFRSIREVMRANNKNVDVWTGMNWSQENKEVRFRPNEVAKWNESWWFENNPDDSSQDPKLHLVIRYKKQRGRFNEKFGVRNTSKQKAKFGGVLCEF